MVAQTPLLRTIEAKTLPSDAPSRVDNCGADRAALGRTAAFPSERPANDFAMTNTAAAVMAGSARPDRATSLRVAQLMSRMLTEPSTVRRHGDCLLLPLSVRARSCRRPGAKSPSERARSTPLG